MASTEIRMPFMEGLKTVPKHSKEDVELIRQWMSHMPHLPEISDDYIHLFLHANYCKLERTKTTIENYFTIRTHATELFSNRDALDPALQSMANNTISGRASGRTPEGCTVWFNKLTETDPSKFDLISMIKLFFMLGDSYISQDGLSPGYIVVFDMKGVALGHLAGVTISLIKTCMNYIQEAAPIRVRSIHVINGGSLLERVMLLIKPFMKAELHELLHIHATTEELSKLFPPEAILRDYGGTGEDFAEVHALARKSLETTYRPFLQQLSTLKVDESKRTGKSTAGEKLFGAEGSFRTLSID